MKSNLSKSPVPRLTGAVQNLTGKVSGLRGDINPDLRGIISPGLRGIINPDLWGDISGITGDCTRITGNIDNCDLTESDRNNGINIADLIK